MDGRAVGVVEGGQIFYIRTDHIGRPVFATNDLGLKVWETDYLPFDGVFTSTGGIDLRFPGQWFQSESGLHQNWMRDYDPTTGRYIQADPLGLVDGASVYGYALQSPGRYVDPRGENSIVLGGGIGGAIGGPPGAIIGAIVGGIGGWLAAEWLLSDDCDEWTDCSKATPYQLSAAGLFGREHEFKEEYVGRPVSRWDICACSDGSIVIRRVGTCGTSGPTHMTYARWK